MTLTRDEKELILPGIIALMDSLGKFVADAQRHEPGIKKKPMQRATKAAKARAVVVEMPKRPHWTQTPEGKKKMRRLMRKAWRQRKAG